MFGTIDIKEELKRVQTKKENSIIDVFNNQIDADLNQETKILNNLNNCNYKTQYAELHHFDSEELYEFDNIKHIAVKYRLRFLPTKYFKNEIPKEAIFKIKALEKSNNTTIKQFYILSPSQNFDLEDVNKDPLLFIPLTNGKFLLVHKWGTDLKWHKKLTALPLRSIETILIFIGIIALVTAIFTPTWLILNGAEVDMGYFGYHRIAWFIYSFILLCSLTTFICFSQSIYPSEYQWDKKTFN
jgi:hypothetical protein